jgi:hypothetical protein
LPEDTKYFGRASGLVIGGWEVSEMRPKLITLTSLPPPVLLACHRQLARTCGLSRSVSSGSDLRLGAMEVVVEVVWERHRPTKAVEATSKACEQGHVGRRFEFVSRLQESRMR